MGAAAVEESCKMEWGPWGCLEREGGSPFRGDKACDLGAPHFEETRHRR
jgi:hypothetical protein